MRKLAISLILLVLAAACAENPPPPVPIDPFHSPEPGQPNPAVVVEIALADGPDFDLVPTGVNGTPVEDQFNDGPGNNTDEPLRIPAGRVRLVYTNTGTIIHNLQVRATSRGGSILESPVASPDDVGEMELDLAAGSYWLACTIGGHDRLGMLRPLLVTE